MNNSPQLKSVSSVASPPPYLVGHYRMQTLLLGNGDHLKVPFPGDFSAVSQRLFGQVSSVSPPLLLAEPQVVAIEEEFGGRNQFSTGHFNNYQLSHVRFQSRTCTLSPLPPVPSSSCEPNLLPHLSPSPHAACPTQPWLDAHGRGGLENRKLAAASDCWCVSQPGSWRTCAPCPKQGPRAEQGVPPCVTTRNWEGKSTR